MTNKPEPQKLFSDSSVEEFSAEVFGIISSALPLRSEQLVKSIDVNDASGVYVVSCSAPLYHGRGNRSIEECQDQKESDLYGLSVTYKLQGDRSGKYLTVRYSNYSIRVHTQAAIRFEYERDKDRTPAAHIHFSGIGGLLSPALMKNGRTSKTDKRKDGDISPLHVPVGGHRFRPSLEDFLYFVIQECGFTGKPGWEPKLKSSREKWFDIQLQAAVRDSPLVAADELRSLGFEVAEPEDKTFKPRRHPSW